MIRQYLSQTNESATVPVLQNFLELNKALGVAKENMPTFYFCQVRMSNYWKMFFHVLLKIYSCQVEIANSWRYS